MDSNILYHFPSTELPSHDAGDISSAKNAGCLELPLFVEGKRQVKYDE